MLDIWRVITVTTALAFLIAIMFSLFTVTIIGTHRKEFHKKHPILSMPMSVLFGKINNIAACVYRPVFTKLVLLFTTRFHDIKIEQKIQIKYEEQIEDLLYQIVCLEKAKTNWHNAWHDQREATGKAYWQGTKYGFYLGESKRECYGIKLDYNAFFKRMSKEEVLEYERWKKSPQYAKVMKGMEEASKSKTFNDNQNLTASHLFTLYQISKGNSVSSFTSAFLEDKGYAKLIWDDESGIKYHYEITAEGSKYLKVHKNELEIDSNNYND